MSLTRRTRLAKGSLPHGFVGLHEASRCPKDQTERGQDGDDESQFANHSAYTTLHT
jgi:hypothetical protein